MSQIKKISAILKKAASTEFEGEASVLMEKANELMAKHGIDMLDIECEDDPMGVDINDMAVSGNWQADLFDHVAKFFNVSVCFENTIYRGRTKSRRTVSLAGKQSARETVKVMWPFILKSVTRQAQSLMKDKEAEQAALKDLIADMESEKTYIYRGAAKRLKRQILSLPKVKRQIAFALCSEISKKISERSQRPEGGNSLIVVNAADAALKEAFPDIEFEKHASNGGFSQAALDKAKQIGLNRQTDANGSPVLAIK